LHKLPPVLKKHDRIGRKSAHSLPSD
jgi:hypothetical protein